MSTRIHRFGQTAVCAITLCTGAGANHDVGSAGDALRLLFADAREAGADMTVGVRPAYLPERTAPEVKQWILDKRYELAADILTTPHVWEAEERAYCAFTQRSPKASISLSYPACERATKVDRDAVFTLIHESVHHFGVEDEAFVDAVATAILASEIQSRRAGDAWWQGSRLEEAPAARSYQGAAWLPPSHGVPGRALVYAGCDHEMSDVHMCTHYFDDLAAFSPDTDRWTHPVTLPSLAPRALSGLAVNAETEQVMAWGGCNNIDSDNGACSRLLADGFLWNAQSAVAERTSPAPLQGRVHHHVLPLAQGFVVWGGIKDFKSSQHPPSPLSDGAQYDSVQKQWTPLPSWPLAPRLYTQAVSLGGNRFAVWGGCSDERIVGCGTYENTGAIYDSQTQSWRVMSQQGAPEPRRFHTLVWTGQRLIVWGGEWNGRTLATGGIYDPESDRWEEMSTIGPIGRMHAGGVWTGSALLLWGGLTFDGREYHYLSDAHAYAPLSDTGTGDVWSEIKMRYPPTARAFHTTLWTGDGLFVWGGLGAGEASLNTGGVLNFLRRPGP